MYNFVFHFVFFYFFFFFQAEDGIRDWSVTGVQTCALPISLCGAKDAFWLARHTSGRPTPHNSYRQHRSLLPLRRTPTSENCDSSFLQQAGSYRRINKQFFSMLYRTAPDFLGSIEDDRAYRPPEAIHRANGETTIRRPCASVHNGPS